jgi:paraquat-inducible protein A
MPDDRVLVSLSYRRPVSVGVILGLSLALNILALILPFVVVDAAGSNPWIYGLLGTVQMLLDSHMAVLACMVFVFSVIFPFAKLAVLSWLWWNGVTTVRRHSLLIFVEKLGKWSLFDVFLVAIMVGLTNDQWLISSASLPGLSCFLFAVILGMLAGEVLTVVVGHRQGSTVAASEARVAPRSGLMLGLVVIVGALLGATLVVPFIQIDDWRLSDRAYSLITLIPALWHNDSPVLAVSMATFIIVMPLVSWFVVALMILGWWKRQPSIGVIHFLEFTKRWTMMSVFALSLGVFLVEGHRFLGTQPLSGVWTLVAGLGLAWIGQWFLSRSFSTRSA